MRTIITKEVEIIACDIWYEWNEVRIIGNIYENPEISIKPLLDGYDLMNLGVKGSDIGDVQKRLKELQLEGTVETKDEAISYINIFKYLVSISS